MFLKPLTAEQEEYEEMYAFEEIAFKGVDGAIYSDEKSERLVDYMLGEDYSTFDEDGQVR